ncbi:MAG: hypothetical protein HRT98_03375 [Mycoplasmatales bacterium]|nr:hypothetical protein [Mycoplasmatales bacterium]
MYKEQKQLLKKIIEESDSENKIIIAGNYGIGKTTMISNLIKEEFSKTEIEESPLIQESISNTNINKKRIKINKIKNEKITTKDKKTKSTCNNEEVVKKSYKIINNKNIKYINAKNIVNEEELITKINSTNFIKEFKKLDESEKTTWKERLSLLSTKTKKMRSSFSLVSLIGSLATFIGLSLNYETWVFIPFILLISFIILIPWVAYYKYYKYSQKKGIIIVDNLDRIKFSFFEKIITHKFNKNKKIIWIFDLQNISDRYKEEYGFELKKPYEILEKYTDKIINLEYSSANNLHIFFSSEIAYFANENKVNKESIKQLNIFLGEIQETLKKIRFFNLRILKRVNQIIFNNAENLLELKIDFNDYYLISLIKVIKPLFAQDLFNNSNFYKERKENFWIINNSIQVDKILKNENQLLKKIINILFEKKKYDIVNQDVKMPFDKHHRTLYFEDSILSTIYKGIQEINKNTKKEFNKESFDLKHPILKYYFINNMVQNINKSTITQILKNNLIELLITHKKLKTLLKNIKNSEKCLNIDRYKLCVELENIKHKKEIVSNAIITINNFITYTLEKIATSLRDLKELKQILRVNINDSDCKIKNQLIEYIKIKKTNLYIEGVRKNNIKTETESNVKKSNNYIQNKKTTL